MAKHGCKCEEEECECPEWIFTFADLVMLMMGFFVILWVLKPAPGKDGEKQQALPVEVLAAIKDAFGYLPDPNSKDPVDVYLLMKKLEQLKPHKGLGDGGKTNLPRRGAEGTDPEVMTIRPGKQVGEGGPVIFESAQATLTAEATRKLDEIAAIVRGHRNVIMVKGHTSLDELPESASAAERMDLSLKRAQVVAAYLISRQVDPDMLRVQGCSTFEPVVQGVYTTAGRSPNRRVEVEATAVLVKEFQQRPATRPVAHAE